MKRLGSSDSLCGLMSICPSATDDHLSPTTIHHQVYTKRDFQSILDDDDPTSLEEFGDGNTQFRGGEKKRRLSVDQVKALEKNFEVENKLEPERKVKLAQELGLQPRQVAVWFQNRRARWKTKNLERDYGVLKASYDSLKANYEALQLDNEALMKEIKEMKLKMGDEDENVEVSDCVKKIVISSVKDEEEEDGEEALISESHELHPLIIEEQTHLLVNPPDHGLIRHAAQLGMNMMEFKDGPSDSDSSAILNEETSPNAPVGACGGVVPLQFLNHHHSLLLGSFSSPTSAPPAFRFNSLPPSSSPSPPPPAASSSITTNYFHNLSSESSTSGGGWTQHQNRVYGDGQLQFVKMEEGDEEELEEHDFFSEEACNFFSDDQAPSLHHLYCSGNGSD